jgi:TP901 family phage tail tape measure protein
MLDSATLQILITAKDEASASLGSLADAIKSIGDAAEAAQAKLAEAMAGIDESFAKSVETVETSTAAMGASLDALADKSTAAAAKTDTANASFSKLGTGTAVAAVAVGFAIDKTVSSYANLQTQMVKLTTSAGESTKNLGEITSGVQAIARSTGTTTTDLGNAMYYVESAGYHGAAGLQVLQAAAQGAKDEQADASTVADAATTVLNAYGLSAKNSVPAVNAMITATSLGKTTLQLFSSSLSSVLPIAAASKISFGQVGGAIATMTAQGMTAQQATQDLRHTISSLANPTAVQTQEMLQLGLNSQTVATQLGSKGLTGTIGELTDSILSHMGPAGTVLQSTLQNATLATADLAPEIAAMPSNLATLAKQVEAGSLSWTGYRTAIRALPPDQENLGAQFEQTYMKANSFNQQLKNGTPAALAYTAALSKATGGSAGLTTALMLSGTHAATFKDNVDKVTASMNDATNKVKGWADMQGTFNQQMSELKEDFITTGQAIGKALIPMLTIAAKLLAAFFLPLAALITKFPLLSAILLAGAAAVTIFIGSMLLIAKVRGFYSDATEELVKLIAMTQKWSVYTKLQAAAQAVLDAVMDANPILLIAIAIAALIAVLVLLYIKFASVREVLKTFNDDLVNMLGPLKAPVEFIEGEFKKAFVDMKKAIEDPGKAIKILNSDFLSLLGPLRGPVTLIEGELKKAFSDLEKAIKDPGKALTILESDFDSLVSHTESVLEKWVSDMKAIWKDISRPVNDAARVLLVVFAPALAITAAKAAIAGGKIAVDFAGQAKDAIVGMVKDGGGALKTFGSNLLQSGKDALIAGKNMAMGLVTTLKNTWSAALQAGKSLLSGIGSALSYAAAGWSAALAWIAANAAIILTAIAVAALIIIIIEIVKHWKDVKQWGMDAWNGIKKAWDAAVGFFSKLGDDIKNFFEKHWKLILAIVLAPVAPIIAAWLIFPKFFSKLWSDVKDAIGKFIGMFVDFFKDEWNGVVAIWNAVTTFFSNLWSGIKKGIGAFGGLISGFFKDEWNGLTNIWNGVTGFFSKLWGDIKSGAGVITGILTSPFKAAFNGIADLWNDSVGKLHFTLPSWVPGIGGKGFSMPTLPKLQSGTTGFGGGLAMVGEVGPELVVLPQGAQVVSNANSQSALNNSGNNQPPVIININAGALMGNQAEAQQFATQIYQSLQQIARRHGMSGNVPNIGILPQ